MNSLIVTTWGPSSNGINKNARKVSSVKTSVVIDYSLFWVLLDDEQKCIL
jgi:hypothetical protein